MLIGNYTVWAIWLPSKGYGYRGDRNASSSSNNDCYKCGNIPCKISHKCRFGAIRGYEAEKLRNGTPVVQLLGEIVPLWKDNLQNQIGDETEEESQPFTVKSFISEECISYGEDSQNLEQQEKTF